jgi:hypothetical protein
VDASSNLFVEDDFNERIRQVSANGIVTTVAGNGAAAFSGDGGAATNASLNRPRAMALDAAGNEGSYHVVVTGPGGSVTSGVATLIVASSPLIYGAVRNPNGSMTLSLVSPPASTNVLSWTTNLASPIVWKPLSTNVAAANGDWQYTDTNTATYRALSFDTVRNRIFFDVETDSGFGRRGWRLKQRAEFLVDVTECTIVQEEGFINLGQAFEDGGVGSQVFAHFDEGADDIDAHGDRARAVEDARGHQGTMFGESAYLLGELEFLQGYHRL